MPATSLLLFTTSQTPLPNRYPTPASTRSLPIPPLLHASLHLAVDRPSPSYTLTKEGVLMIPNPEDEIDAINGTRAAVAGEQEGRMQGPAVADEDAEVTVKFYLVSASPVTATSSSVRAKQQITRALRNLQHYKAHDPRWRGDRARRWIDTFLIGWKGVEYRGERRSSVGSAKKLSPDAERAEAAQREQALGSFLTDEQKREIAEIWTDLPRLVPQAKRLGTLSLSLPLLQYLDTATGATMAKSNGAVDCPVAVGAASGTRAGREQATEAEAEMVEMEQGPSTRHVTALNGHSSSSASAVTETDKSLLEALISPPPTSPSAATPQQPTRRLPAVNCMNTPDCHWLPADLLDYAQARGIELWAGGGAGESCDPLPSAHLHNTLHEFVGRFPADVFPAATELGRLISVEDEARAPAAVEVEWVLGYTVISRSRNVVQDKGYIVSAAL